MSITTTHLLDANVLVTEDLRFGDTQVRQPDFTDPVEGTAVWIGEDASVEVPFERLDDIARLARTFVRTTQRPEDFGIRVSPFGTACHPAFAGWKDAERLSLWAEFSETVVAA